MNGIAWVLIGVPVLVMAYLGTVAVFSSDFSAASRKLHEEIKIRQLTYDKRRKQLTLFLYLLSGGALIMTAMTVVSIRWFVDYASQEYRQIDNNTEILLLFIALGCLAATVLLAYQAAVTLAKKRALARLARK